MHRPGRGFRIFVVILLLGIFFELLTLIGIFGGDDSEHGNIGVVDVMGEIGDPKPILDQLRKFKERDDIKAIVLRIDSPGGAVGSSQEIHDAVLETMKKKKVVASFANLAASGGYYIAAPANKIVADPGTITGSIGVIAEFFVVEDLLKKAHLKWEVIKAGEVKDMGSPLRPLTPKERALLQDMTNDIHAQFIEAVASGRKLSIEAVRKIADGRVFSGRQAKAVGLVDELGGLDKALKVVAELAHIKEEPKPVFHERDKFSWLKKLVDGKFEVPSFKMEYRFAP